MLEKNFILLIKINSLVQIIWKNALSNFLKTKTIDDFFNEYGFYNN